MGARIDRHYRIVFPFGIRQHRIELATDYDLFNQFHTLRHPIASTWNARTWLIETRYIFNVMIIIAILRIDIVLKDACVLYCGFMEVKWSLKVTHSSFHLILFNIILLRR